MTDEIFPTERRCREQGAAAGGAAAGNAAKDATAGATLVAVLLSLVVLVSAANVALLVQRNWPVLEPRLNPPLTRVEVEGGSSLLSPAELEAALAPFAGTGFFQLDLELARQRVESLRWVASAAVGRRWPDTLHLRLVEERVIAHWGDDALITQGGEVIPWNRSVATASLPLLSGPADSHFQVMRQYQRFNQILYPFGLRLSGLSTSPRRSWRLQIDGMTEVVLGSDDLVDRLQRYVHFRQGLAEAEQQRHAIVDLRYGSQLSVRLRSAETITHQVALAGTGEALRR